MNMMNQIRNTNEPNRALQPLILAIETSSRVGSVALALGTELLGQATFSAPLRHSAEIFGAIAGLLSRAGYGPSDLRQVHISAGPGSFTGLRIAVAAAKAMHLAGGVRIVAVDCLDVIAANAKDVPSATAFQWNSEDSPAPRRLATVLDAKRGQFFTAVYEYSRDIHGPASEPTPDGPGYRIPAPADGDWRKTLPDCLLSAADLRDRFANPDEPILVAGDGLLHHRSQFEVEGIQILDPALWSPQATGVLLLGRQKAASDRFSDPLTLVPFYLRGPEVTLRKRA